MENFASNFSHVKILFGDKDSSNPRCAHGPTLLMERGESRFYACAAYRSRKECDFYLTEGEALGQAKQMRIKASVKQMLEGKDHSVMYSKVQKAVEKNEEFNLCRGCDKVLEEESCCGETTIVTKQMLNRPSTFLMPKVLSIIHPCCSTLPIILAGDRQERSTALFFFENLGIFPRDCFKTWLH